MSVALRAASTGSSSGLVGLAWLLPTPCLHLSLLGSCHTASHHCEPQLSGYCPLACLWPWAAWKRRFGWEGRVLQSPQWGSDWPGLTRVSAQPRAALHSCPGPGVVLPLVCSAHCSTFPAWPRWAEAAGTWLQLWSDALSSGRRDRAAISPEPAALSLSPPPKAQMSKTSIINYSLGPTSSR